MCRNILYGKKRWNIFVEFREIDRNIKFNGNRQEKLCLFLDMDSDGDLVGTSK